jgi:uncharacterized protein (DUF2267 family)
MSKSSTSPEPGTSGDHGRDLMELLVKELRRRLTGEEAKSLSASELELVRKLLADNSVTLASIRRGDFGDMPKAVAEQFPFPEEDGVRPN